MSGVEQSRRTGRLRWIGLLAATVVALYLCWTMLQPFIEVLLWAVVLVIVFYPVHRRIQARVGSPGWSAVLSCLLVIVIILVPLTLHHLRRRERTGELRADAPAEADGTGASSGRLLDPNSPYVGPVVRWLGQYVDLEQSRSQEFIAERLKG